MTTNIFSVLNTAKVGLLSQQLAIEVTGQNIANVQTEGYTRQEVSFEPTAPRRTGLGFLGTGVKVGGIERAHDQFLFLQMLNEEKPKGTFETKEQVFDQLEALFNENDGRSLNRSMSDFFNSFQDLSTNPTGLAERATVLATAETLVSNFNSVGVSLHELQVNMDQLVDAEVVEINDLTQQIAELNRVIHGAEPGGLKANDLRDERDRLIKELAEKIDVNVVDEMNGQFSLTFDNGRALILGDRAFELGTQLNGNNKTFKDVTLDDGSGGNFSDITGEIRSGRLRGLIDMRDVEIEEMIDKFDRLAAGFVREVNRVHRQGFGLDGSTGNDFFTPLSPTTHVNTLNSGNAQLTVVNTQSSTASVDRFEVVFNSASSFTLINENTGLSEGTFNFTSGTTFNIAGDLAVTVTGTPAAGDRIRFSQSENAARTMSLSSDVKFSRSKIAAGSRSATDGENGIDLAFLQNTLSFDGTSLTNAGSGSFTFDEFYSSMISEMGVEARSARGNMDQQEAIILQLENRREGLSGVSIDEEMLNMIKFQQAFNASARVVTVVDEMFDILQNRI